MRSLMQQTILNIKLSSLPCILLGCGYPRLSICTMTIFPVQTWSFMSGKQKGALTDIRFFPIGISSCLLNIGSSAASQEESSSRVHGPGVTLILPASISSSRQVPRKPVSCVMYLLTHAAIALPATYSKTALTSNIFNLCLVMWIPVLQMYICM